MTKHFIETIDFKEHKTCIFGIQGSGKSELARFIVKKHFKTPLLYKVNPDWDNQKNVLIYEPKNVMNEFEYFCSFARKKAMDGKIDCIILDEADLFIEWNYQLKEDLHDLILNHRHRGKEKRGYGVALLFISRRPQDLPTKLVESSKHICVFKMEGDNAIKKFNNISQGFGDSLQELDNENFEFYYKALGKQPVKCSKIPIL